MDRNNLYFFTSGFIALSLFTFFLLLFFYMMFSSSKIKMYALQKDNYISVSIDIPKKQEIKKSKQKPNIKPIAPVETPKINIGNLFSDVYTKKINHKKTKPKKIKKQINKRLQEALNRSKISQKKEFSVKPNEIKKATSSGSEVNEYLAKIQAIVYQHFSPPQNTQGNSVKCVIELDAFGKMIDFRVLGYSSNDLLNEEVDKVKGRLKGVVFPQNPQHKSSRMVVILISKE